MCSNNCGTYFTYYQALLVVSLKWWWVVVKVFVKHVPCVINESPLAGTDGWVDGWMREFNATFA